MVDLDILAISEHKMSDTGYSENPKFVLQNCIVNVFSLTDQSPPGNTPFCCGKKQP